MLDSLLLFLFMASPAIILLAWLVLLKRPEGETYVWRELSEEEKEEAAIMDMILNAWVHEPNKGFYYALERIDNEDTRPVSPHEDSFSHEELWEAAGNIPRESAAQKQQIDKWVNEAIENAGKDYEL